MVVLTSDGLRSKKRVDTTKKRGGKTVRNRDGFESRTWTGPVESCLLCGGKLRIVQHRERTLQTLQEKLVISARDTSCGNARCSGSNVYRPIEESRLSLPDREFGLDVVCFVLEKHFQGVSLAKIHEVLTEIFEVRISQTHVGNLLRLGMAMVHARNLESESVRFKLSEQGHIVLSIDAVSLGERCPGFYVLRDVVSSEILFAQRLETRRAIDLVPLFKRVKDLGIPVLGIVSDKEAAFIEAAKEVFPGTPHQICQAHYLMNLAKPSESTSATLGRGVRTTVQTVRKLELELLKQEDHDLTEIEKEERKVALKLCSIVRTGGKISGEKLLNPTPLKRYERLEQATEATKKALKRPGSWPILTKLLVCLSVLDNFQNEARRLAREVDVLRWIARLLKMVKPSDIVRKNIQAFLDELDEESSDELACAEEELAAARAGGEKQTLKAAIEAFNTATNWRSFFEHVQTVSERFWAGLFHCYDHPQLPSTNNALEAFFGVLKRLSRKATGRRSTGGGPLETCPEFFIEAFTLLKGRSHAEIVSMLGDIPKDEVSKAIAEFEKLAVPARDKRSIARDPEAAIRELLEEWSGTPPSRSGQV